MARLKYFFPDSQDFVDPSFDFIAETRSEHRVRQRDDLYPHEIFAQPHDGILVSKAIVDGLSSGGAGKYTQAQRMRFYRERVRRFFRLPEQFMSMGDCGAFNYAKQYVPPYSVQDVTRFYARSGFDYGISLDHIVFAYETSKAPLDKESLIECRRRQELTLGYAKEFIDQSARHSFVPLGVAHGWNAESYAQAVERLIAMGYDYITLGGMVPLKTPQILEVLAAVDRVRRPETRFHLLGITRLDSVSAFENYGVASVDSTTPLQQAYKDKQRNYHLSNGDYYTALRIPQLNANITLSRKIKSGEVNQDEARELEKACLNAVRDYAEHRSDIESTLEILMAYERLHAGKELFRKEYRRTLEDRPWEKCFCEICLSLGVEVMIFRGAERNRRRGFHNIRMLYQRLQASSTPCQQLQASKML